ncbi:MAG: DUF3343 domain-containing protein [Dehalococcoidia bacterium]
MKRKKKTAFEGEGLVLFEQVEETLKAEKILKGANYACKLIAPPPDLRKGCDLALQINLAEQMGIERVLSDRDTGYLEVATLRGGAGEILDIVKVTDLGDATMVKAGNMKLTFDRSTGMILNTSGGGCPDIPYLHTQLVGRKLIESPRPRDIGFTLCGLMLDRALEESIKIWNDGGGNHE